MDGEERRKDDDIGQDKRGEGTPRHKISEGGREEEREKTKRGEEDIRTPRGSDLEKQ